MVDTIITGLLLKRLSTILMSMWVAIIEVGHSVKFLIQDNSMPYMTSRKILPFKGCYIQCIHLSVCFSSIFSFNLVWTWLKTIQMDLNSPLLSYDWNIDALYARLKLTIRRINDHLNVCTFCYREAVWDISALEELSFKKNAKAFNERWVQCRTLIIGNIAQ